MSARQTIRRRRRRMLAVAMAASAVLGVAAAAATGDDGPPPPAPCNGSPQITDVTGDGHHASSDVLSAWLSEAAGGLQAVIQVRAGSFVPEHTDADINGSGFALLFTLGGQTDYVRTRAAPDGSLTYDYGTYSSSGYFTSLGATTGSVVHGNGAGTTTIDVPPALGATAGKVLASPFVLTYDGITGGVPGWVDHAPGGEAPDDPARGADYVVGACGAAAGGSAGGGVTSTQPGAGSVPGGSSTAATTAVLLSAPAKIVGSAEVLITGQVAPARGGIGVAITRAAHASTVSHVKTASDGSFALNAHVRETTQVRALAGAIHSGTLTIDVRSRTRVRLHRARNGAWSIRGSVSPMLPGRALLLRPGSPTTVATRKVLGGVFTFRFSKRRPPHGAYQVVYVPSASRAERSTSNTARVR
jgi:hypothetical protein